MTPKRKCKVSTRSALSEHSAQSLPGHGKVSLRPEVMTYFSRRKLVCQLGHRGVWRFETPLPLTVLVPPHA